MNRIFKVIWSKTKHCYIVVSEYAKANTKAAHTGLRTTAAAAAVAAMLLAPVNYNYAWAADIVTVTDTSTTQQMMYTKDGADNTFATKGSLTTEAASREAADTKEAGIREAADTKEAAAREAADTTEAADRAAADTTLQSNIDKEATARETADTKLQTAVDAKANAADVYSKTDTDTKLADKANAADVYSKTDTDTKLADKANVADVYSKADADTTFATKTEVSKADTDLQKSIDEEARKRKYSVTNLEKADANEAAAREAADTQLDSRTSAVETKTASLTRVAAANSTSINESRTYKGNQYSATLQVNGSGAQIGVVNKEAAGLANDGGTAYTEYRAITGAIVSKATNDISSTSSNGQIIDTAGDTAGEYSQVATAKSTGTTFTYNDGTSSSSTTIKGNAISTGSIDATGNISAASVVDNTLTSGNYVTAGNTVGENIVALDTQAKANADAIDEEARKRKYSVTNLEKADQQLQTNINNEAAAREADDKALDDRITNVKEYLENQTSENYVSKADAAVQDGAVVKAANTIGENVTNLDAALAKETAARIGADAAQDKVIEQVNQNMVDGVNTINKNMADGFTALNQADAKELAGRKAADTKLVEAVNSGVSLSDDNVLQKNTTTIDAQGNVTTSKTAANEMILNKGKDNQITLSENGIKVGLNSGVMDKDGFYAGGDTADAAKAALKADGSIKGGNGKFTVDKDGKVTAASGKIGNVDITSAGAVSGVTDLTASGTITGNKLTDGVASLQNGNLTTTGNINAHDIVATGDISGKAITGTSLNTQGGDINGGAITGTTITGTTGSFGSLTTAGNASVGGTLSSNGLTNTGNATTDTLTVNHNATVGGSLVVTGAISGGQITGTGLDVGAGPIKTTGAVKTGTLETTGNATIGGNLTVDKNLTVNGTFDAKTLSSTVDANNYTTINGGKTQSMNLKMDAVTGETKASASTFDENGSNTWAKDDDSIGKSTVTADGISQRLSDTGDNPTVYAERTMSQGTDNKYSNKYSMVDTVKDGDKTNVATQSAAESSSILADKDGLSSSFKQNVSEILNEIHASDTKYAKLDQKADTITSEVKDGENTTSTTQTATNLTNTAKNGIIKNDARTLVNTASDDMTNTVGKDLETTVGGEMKTTVTGNVTEDYKADLSTTVGGNKSETVTGTSTETVTGKKTENYNGGLETTVTGDEKHTVNGSQINAITDDQTNTIGGSQTTTVTGDSSLTADNINNTAKNKITNKALDVETDAASSIVSKVSNDAGSNTSTQLSDQTKEEMSQADGKTASYLRGAAEEKSQLIDGSKKTTIDTVAGQTNTNITDGTNTSNDLQKADQIASSVTDGTNTTVVNQNAKSLASSITDGTKANNTNSTVDKSEQLIKASDTQYSATTKTATKMEDALVSGGSVIDVIKNLDDAANPFIGSAVTDGTNSTGVTQTAKDITNTAKNGTIANEAKDITNHATENMTNTVDNDLTTTVGGEMKTTVTGKVTEDYKSDLDTKVGGNETHYVAGNQTNTVSGDQQNTVSGSKTETVTGDVTEDYKANLNTTVGGNQTTTVTGDSSLTANNIHNTATEALTNDAKTITNKASESVTTQIGDGSAVKSVMNGNGIANTATGKAITNDAATITNTGTTSVTNQVDNNKVLVDTEKVQSAFGDTIYTTWDANGITNNATDKTVATTAKDIKNTATGDITNTASTGTITNDAKTLLNKASDSITDKVGENVERTMTTKKISESVKDGAKSNSFSKTAEKDISIITDGTKTSTLSQLADSVNTSLKNGTQSLNNTKTVTEDVTKVTDENTGAFSSSSQKADAMTNTVKNGSKSNTVTETASTSEQKLVSGNIIDILKDAENGYVNTTVSNSDGSSSTGVKQTYTDITSTAKQGTITNDAKNLVNKAEEKLSNSAAEIENTATNSIKDMVGKSTVTTTTDGTTFENTDHNRAIGDGSITKTTISGNTLETGKATMDYAEVMKDLRVGGTTTTKDLHVTNNATIDGTLGVTGAANFQDTVTVAKDLSVGGNATVAGNVTANSYKVGDKTYIDANGINANDQKITNVAAGTEDSDAANYGQLRKVERRVDGVENRVTNVENRVDKMDSRIDKVGANAAAMANLHPLEFDEDSKWNVAAAVGNYKGETAAAVGAFYRPNEDVMFNLSTTFGNDENMVGGGLSLRLGKGGNHEKDKKLKAAIAENNDLRAKVDDLTARMDALLSVINPNMSKEFPDVPENHWAYEAVTRLAGNDIVQGYEDGKFHGERTMTRYEMAEIIYNALSRGAKAEKKLVEEFKPELQAMAAQKQAK